MFSPMRVSELDVHEHTCARKAGYTYEMDWAYSPTVLASAMLSRQSPRQFNLQDEASTYACTSDGLCRFVRLPCATTAYPNNSRCQCQVSVVASGCRLNLYDTSTLQTTLLFHVIPGQLFSSDVGAQPGSPTMPEDMVPPPARKGGGEKDPCARVRLRWVCADVFASRHTCVSFTHLVCI